MSKRSGGTDKLIDTLNLSEERWQELSAKLERINTYSMGQRRYERLPYRRFSQIAVAIEQPDGKWATYIVRSRNLCPGGIGFIHGGYIHLSSRCRVILKDIAEQPVCLEGIVKHCVMVDGNVHCVGVQFYEEIDVNRFVVVDNAGKTNA